MESVKWSQTSTSSHIKNIIIRSKSMRTHFSNTSLSMQPKTSSRPPFAKSAFPSITTLNIWKCKRSILTLWFTSLTSDKCGSFVSIMIMNNTKQSMLPFTTFGDRTINWSTPKSWLTWNQSSARTILLLTFLPFTTLKSKNKPNASKTSSSTLPLWFFPLLFAKSVCTFCSK